MSTSAEQQEPSFGKRLRRLREAAGLTQEELATRAGLTPNAISDLERGRRRRPYPHTVRSLADALGLSEDERISFLASVPRGRPGDSAAPAPSTTARASYLPMPLTPLVGREQEVAAVRSSLRGDSARLVTLTGPGGVGKTRLALEVARDIGDRFPEGVALVTLASLGDAALVVPTVAQSLGLRGSTGRPMREVLHGYLRARRLLLVLDNFEHLLDAAPEVAELLAASLYLKVLATSRAPLRIRGELEYPVTPLKVPDPSHMPDVENVASSPAAELFVDRAREANPSFLLTRKNAAAIAAIAWRLDGLPLALELAATQTRFLGPTELLSTLDRALESGGARDLPERQRTMRATLDWSHDLLSGPEQTAFRRLSVFVGGFTLEAAEAVNAEGEASSGDVLELLGRLVEQSLVTVEASPSVDEGTRYSMLEPVRQYARAKLEDSEEEEQVRGLHAGYYEALALQAEQELKGPGQVEWMGLLGREHDNLRAAMGWLLDRGEAERVVEIGWGVWWFWFVRGFLVEGKRWMERALAPGATLSITCRAKALTVVSGLAWSQGEYDRAAATLAEGVRLARGTDDRAVLATTLLLMAFTAVARGDHARAGVWADESSLLHRALGDGSSACLALLAAAHAAGVGGDPTRAVRLVDEGEALARESGASFSLASALNVRAMFLQLKGDDARAAGLLRESLGLSWALRDTYALGYGLTSLAGALVGLGQGERAARLYGTAEALREVTGTPIQYKLRQALYKRQVAALREQLDAETFKAAWAEGRAMTLEEAITEALVESI